MSGCADFGFRGRRAGPARLAQNRKPAAASTQLAAARGSGLSPVKTKWRPAIAMIRDDSLFCRLIHD